MIGATFFFLAPISTIVTTSVVDFSGIIPEPILALMRFMSIVSRIYYFEITKKYTGK